MHNLGIVFNFEFTRAIKKKSFWISIVLFPALIAGIFGIAYASNRTTNAALTQPQNERFSLAITDDSHLLSPNIMRTFGAHTITDKTVGITAATNGSIDAYFYYPRDITKGAIEIYANDVGLFNNSKYDSTAKYLLEASVGETVSSSAKTVLKGDVTTTTKTFKNGKAFDGFKSMIAPGIFLVLFYLVIAMFGNQMLTSTVEEKENRVIEMLLTSVETRTLIIGKIIALILLGLLQVTLILVPAIIGYLIFKDQLSLPSFDLSSITFDWWRIFAGFIIFILSFLFFTGLLVTIGASVPTAKEASTFIGAVMLLIFGPLYAASLFISSPESLIVQFLSYFPLTSPIPLLLRNAVGNLPVHEVLIALGILLISTVFIVQLAVRVFRYGALEYSRKLSLKEIFTTK